MKMLLLIVKRSFERLQYMLEQKSACLKDFPYTFCWLDCGKSGKALYLLPQSSHEEEQLQKNGIMESFISSSLARFIVLELREMILRDILRFNYFYFRKEEREEIINIANRSLSKGLASQRQDTFREVIERKLRDYLLEGNEHLNLEGFIFFRLQDYQQELKKTIDDAVESYLMEREYREFVRLLKYFLEIQQPKIDMVHLSVDEKGQFQITDHHLNVIDPRDWEEFDLEEFDGENDYEDILVSMLVSVAPRHIMLHQNVLPRYPRAVDTLRRIFDQRLLICDNCTACRRELSKLAKGDKKKV